jgi:hypothetical protein
MADSVPHDLLRCNACWKPITEGKAYKTCVAEGAERAQGGGNGRQRSRRSGWDRATECCALTDPLPPAILAISYAILHVSYSCRYCDHIYDAACAEK